MIAADPIAPPRRVAHVVYHHAPLDVRVFEKQCRSLAARGYLTTIVAWDPPTAAIDGVSFERIDSETKPLRRGWLLTPVSYFRRMHAVYRAARATRADIYHVHEPLLIPVLWLCRLQGARVIYDAHEHYRDVARRAMDSSRVRGLLRYLIYAFLEWTACIFFDRIVAANAAIARQFPRAKTTIIHNYPVMSSQIANADGRPSGSPCVIYVGGITAIRGIHEMVAAMDLVADARACMVIVGKFASADLQHSVERAPGWAKVKYLGWKAREDVDAITRTCRAGLLCFHPGPNHDEAMPNKLFEYMAAGIPVIASHFDLWRTIITEADAGVVVDPLDPYAIARAIDFLMANPTEADRLGRNGRLAVTGRFNWEAEARRLVSVYDGLAVS